VFSDRVLVALLALAAALLAVALADLPAIATSVAGLAGLAVALGAERDAARDGGVPLGALERPPALHYVLIAFPFLFAVSAAGEEHLLACVGAAVLTQAAYVRRWRAALRA
jgi:hypothetical protein